jgi:hypothetical protein
MQITDAGCPDRHEQFWLLWVLQYQGAWAIADEVLFASCSFHFSLLACPHSYAVLSEGNEIVDGARAGKWEKSAAQSCKDGWLWETQK